MNKTYHIEGMTCGGCVKSVSKIINDTLGVQSAQVSLEDNNAHVIINKSYLNGSIEKALDKSGYKATEKVPQAL